MHNKEEGAFKSWNARQESVSLPAEQNITIGGTYPGKELAAQVLKHKILVHKGTETNLYKE